MKHLLLLALFISTQAMAWSGDCKYVNGEKICNTAANTRDGKILTSCDSNGFCAQGTEGGNKGSIKYYQDGKDVTNQVKNMKGYRAP